MSELKKEYDEIKEKRTKIIDELKELDNNEIVKRYLELKKENASLLVKQKDLYCNIKKEEYEKCNHIIVCTKIDIDDCDGKSHPKHVCIKCGLNDGVLKEYRDWLSYTDKIMYDYLRKNEEFLKTKTGGKKQKRSRISAGQKMLF